MQRLLVKTATWLCLMAAGGQPEGPWESSTIPTSHLSPWEKAPEKCLEVEICSEGT